MPVSAINDVRRDQTLAELETLRAAMTRWLDWRHERDRDDQGLYIGRHKTQLQALRTVLLGAADGLSKAADTIDVEAEPGALYDACRDVDLAIVWLHRLWDFYRDKFDQRDSSEPIGRIVRAADEIVWSCYHDVMDRATRWDTSVTHGASPLAYVAPEYSPAALDSESPVTGSLRLDVQLEGWDQADRDLVETLPVPLLRLPPWCVQSPWSLVHVAHEVGHELYATLNLTAHVRSGVRAAARTALNDAEADRWRNWSEEVFADVFSVLVMGSAALRGVTEVERTAAARSVRATAKYPAPAVRLALLAETARRLDLSPERWLAGVDPVGSAQADPAASRHLSAISPVLDFLVDAALPGSLGSLRELCDASRDDWKEREARIATWMSQVSVSPAPRFEADLATARYVCAASVAVWHDLAAEENAAERKKKIVELASAVTSTLLKSGAPGTRAAVQPDSDETSRGRALSEALVKNARRLRQTA